MEEQYLAHIAEDGREQTVRAHLEGTAELCGRFAAAFGAEEQGRWIGLAHDVGKYSEEFQKRLRGGHIVDHSTAGALECHRKDPGALWAACCVAGHHGGLPDAGNGQNDQPDDPTVYGRLKRGKDGKIPKYEMPVPLDTVPPLEGFTPRDLLTSSFLTRMLFSCLVDADFLDTEAFMSGGTAERGGGEPLSVLLDRLYEKKIGDWLKPDPERSELNRTRCDILRKCVDSADRDRGLYTLTVPTGGGKTIASMAFALHHAVRNGMERIIYVIPYTSIIEQNAQVFREIFGPENVVEHHSNASFTVREERDGKSGAGDAPEAYRNAKAVENWDAPIIVTTAVQFFESLYGNRPAQCRKLHNIANSVVIFDEAQMIPIPHLRPCVAAIAKLVQRFRATAVLCTATQPALNRLIHEFAPDLPEPAELCPGTVDLYAKFRRVTFRNAGELDMDTLAAQLAVCPQALCIVNTRRSARELFRKLPEEGSFHLSTLMYPAHRRAVLDEIRRRLKAHEPCRVVSTSLIEAGVDVDFPAVWREAAGLDSILQAAGRCNREGKRPASESVVTVFSGVSATPVLQKVNIGATAEVWRDGMEPDSPETVRRYFETLLALKGPELDKSGVIQAFTDFRSGNLLPFRTVAEHFHLIDDDAKTVYIPRGDGRELADQLRTGPRSRELYRKLGQYAVNVYERNYRDLLSAGALEAVDEDSGILLTPDLYSENTGLPLEAGGGEAFMA